MVDLNAHEAGNGGKSQGKPTAHGVLLYSEALLGSCRILRLDAHPVVDGESQFLLATEVTFRRLDGNMSK